MTTIDHQQVALSAAREAARDSYRRMQCTGNDEAIISLVSKASVTAAAPRLRAEWEQELARAVKRLPWNGVTHGGTMVPLDSVLALLEGSGK